MDRATEKSVKPGLLDVPVPARKSSDGSSRKANALCARREVRPSWFKWKDGHRWFIWPTNWNPPPHVRRAILIAFRRHSGDL